MVVKIPMATEAGLLLIFWSLRMIPSLFNLLTDVLYAYVDPRVQLS